MNNSHSPSLYRFGMKPSHRTTNAFPQINYKIDHERQTWMEANCDNWPYFYDVATWPGALEDLPLWKLDDALDTWLYRVMQFDCADHYGIVCFENMADALQFRDEFAPMDREVILYWMKP
jgi:hypothetical protein